MYEIGVTCKNGITTEKLLELIIKTGVIEQERNKESVIYDNGFLFPESNYKIIYKGTEATNKLLFIMMEEEEGKEVALAYGKFVTFLLSKSVPINEKMEVDREIKSKDSTDLTKFIEAIWIRQERQPNEKE